MQKLWDANGAAIYEANQEYQAKHGKEMDAGSRSKAIKDATVNGVFNAGAYASNLETAKTRQEAQNERMANKMTRVEREEEVRWQASQKTAEEKKAQDLQEGLAAYYAAMRQGEQEAKPNWWEQTKSFVREKIVQPYIQPVVTALDEKLYQPYFKPTLDTIKRSQAYQAAQNSITPKKIATVALTLALGANTVQWVNNLKSNPDVFSPARDYAQSLVDDLRLKHPPAPEKHSLAYIVSHPYDVMATGSDFLNTLISVGASYADAIWQQNPLTQLAVESLETLEDSLCSRVTSQAWANRCTAAFYLSAGLTATPFDTTLGVANSFVVDPIVGFLKQGALSIETYAAIPDLVTAIREEGWEGAKDFVAELWTNRLEIVLNDKQMQSAFFVECLILFALIAAPLAGVVILGMTAKGLIELDAAVTASKNKKSLIELVTSHEVRTTVVSSALILALMTAGLSKQVSEFRAFQERLSPSAQASFQTLSLLEQTRLADLASKMKLSPGAMEFYLTETARPGSPLAELPLTDALRVSNLAAESGRGAFVLDYISRYGVDAAIKNASPEGLTFYLEQAKTPGSMMSSLTPQQGVILSELSPTSITKVTGLDAAKIPKGVTPDINTPVLSLTPQEVSVLTKLSTRNPNAEYAMLGLFKDGWGYTLIGSKGYTYLDMPSIFYENIFKKYPGDFRLINQQYLAELAGQNKPIILETPYTKIELKETTGAYWEVFEILGPKYKYQLHEDAGPFGFDLLIPPNK